MTTFYICRHGETENNTKQRFSGWIDTPLTNMGMQNAISTAGKLRHAHIDMFVSSDLGRAFVTAYIISRQTGYTKEIVRTAELREVNYGDFHNRPYTEYPQMSPAENGEYIAPGGESLALMQRRVIRYIQKLSADNPHKTILLVAHDGTINAIRGYFKGEDIGTSDLVRNPHDCIAKFVCDGSAISQFEYLA